MISAALPDALRTRCKVLGPALNIQPDEISARAVRAGGAMSLLRAKIDPLHIRLLGRWKSWTMIRYLHRSATDTVGFAAAMLVGGHFTISTHDKLHCRAISARLWSPWSVCSNSPDTSFPTHFVFSHPGTAWPNGRNFHGIGRQSAPLVMCDLVQNNLLHHMRASARDRELGAPSSWPAQVPPVWCRSDRRVRLNRSPSHPSATATTTTQHTIERRLIEIPKIVYYVAS